MKARESAAQVGRGFSRAVQIACLCFAFALSVSAQRVAPAASDAEAATIRRFNAIRHNPALLLPFLREMPKGGDLHNHLSGSIYAESYLRWAAEDNLCLLTSTLSIVAAPCDAASGKPPASDVLRNATLYGQAVDAMSMRNWKPATTNGHDHFFATFAKFGLASGRTGDMITEVASRAASEHVSYLELMFTTDGGESANRGRSIEFSSDYAAMRDRLLAGGFRAAVTSASKSRVDEAEKLARSLMRCETPTADAGCRVTLRYVLGVSRAASLGAVFGQLLGGFEIAGADPRVVSLNLLQPEDDPNAVANFGAEMAMLAYLQGVYPRVPITLHAGELSAGLVPPEVLRFHIRESVQKGHAMRIGHGVDVMHEDDAPGLLKEMAAKHVLVEINLTSNDVILGVKGSSHPLRTYLQYGVPVALSTDDMGVSRSTHTQEFQKAVEEQGLDYATLKKLARNSIEYSFADAPTKAKLKIDLSAAFTAFERGIARLP
jgi:adenosine deaminase